MKYTLLTDGPSDRALRRILDWALQRHGVREIQSEWADLRRLPNPPRELTRRLECTLELYPCELLFVHRDAEAVAYEERATEITRALDELDIRIAIVKVVPVRMMEAWLLHNEHAIRHAAGNPRGRMPLVLPRLMELEGTPDPKDVLHQLLRRASGLGTRRRRTLNVDLLIHRVAEHIDDYSSLDRLPAFARFDAELNMILEQNPAWLR